MVGGMEITTKDLEAAVPYLSQTGHYELQIAVLTAQKAELQLQLDRARHALSVMEDAAKLPEPNGCTTREGAGKLPPDSAPTVGSSEGVDAAQGHTEANAGKWGHTPSFLGVKV